MKKCLSLTLALITLFTLAACAGESEPTYTLVEEGVYTLSDGTRVDHWRSEALAFELYCLPDDGDTLLLTHGYREPDVYLHDISPDVVSETAYAAIYAHFDEQGPLFDIEAELEKVYAEYLTADGWQSYVVDQSTSRLSVSERVIYYSTELILPLGGGESSVQRFPVAFDRETGEVIDCADLFTVSESELADTLFALSGITDTALLADMDAAFSLDCLSFGGDSLLVEFPADVLPETGGLSFGVRFDDLKDVIHDWAIPSLEA